ncbi:sensor histidine kinase [Bizionia saleffrena]|uniref:histidine kinase n=1 Tax=Bizionia saleffrena TaxID=291189 RepID=A0A8H2QKB3_9FLAO|nr:sensor histidine kinase [Bizionia saleffrena]TYB69431.1 sensor histidine kinase [Bizionia saleffrena]
MKYLLISILYFISQVSFSQSDNIVDFGQKLIYENKLDQAIKYYDQHLLEPSNKEQEIYLLLGLAEIYKLQLDFNTANNFYLKAYKKIKSSNNKPIAFFYHVKKAEFYRKRTLYRQASSQLDKAEVILKNTKIDDAMLSKYYGRKAALFSEYFRIPDSTLFYADKALQLAKKRDDKDVVFYSTLEISGVYEERKQYDKAIDYLQELIVFSIANNLVQQQADAYVNYTRILIKDKQFETGLKESMQALKLAKGNNSLFNEILFTDNVRNCYEKLGNIEKAYEYLETRLKLTDIYYKKEHNEFLFELEEKYDLAAKESQIKINNLEILNQKRALASNKVKLYVATGLFVFSITVVLLFVYFLRRSRKSNKQLQILSQENEFLLSEANHRINNNLQLVIILISDQLKKTSDQERFQLKNILTKVEAISTLHRHLYKNEDKRKVDINGYLNDVKTSFFDVFKENDIQVNFKIASVEIPTDYAMYFGLLLTELCINSIKYAFNNQEDKEINFEIKYNDRLFFVYSDNGLTTINTIIKPKLIDKICRQLEMEYTINTADGFSFSVVKEIEND